MKNKVFIMFFSLIMAISANFAYGNESYAAPCPVDKNCISCIQKKHDCCKHCKKDCKDCKNCCVKSKTAKQQVKTELNCQK